MEIDRNGLEVLDPVTCRRLLVGTFVGRVGLTIGALPSILPVNFRIVDNAIVFRTGMGGKLAAALDHAVVAFEADEVDALTHTGWSVLVVGVASLVTDPDEIERCERANVPRWALEGRHRLVRVSMEMISGRRIDPSAARVVAG